MGAAGVKADAGRTVFVAAHRELYLVAVAVHLRGGKGIQHRHIQSADAAEGVGDALLLGPQLGGVVHVPQAAAAAGAGDSAVHRDAVIAGGSTRDEDGLALRRVGNAAAVAGKTLDAEGEKLVFL